MTGVPTRDRTPGVDGTSAYYLRHRAEAEAYLAEQESEVLKSRS